MEGEALQAMSAPQKTPGGRATRQRIVAAASELISERGVAETSLEDVMERAGASKSQLYHYFDDRAALLRAVVEHNTDGVIGYLGEVDDSWAAIRSWLHPMVEPHVERPAGRRCPGGAPL